MKSTQTKFTPGPWKVFGNVIRAIETIDGQDRRGEIVAMPMSGGDPDRRNLGNFEANARLIAAAPDLLAACERALSELDGDPHRYELVDAINAAISKAKGGMKSKRKAVKHGK